MHLKQVEIWDTNIVYIPGCELQCGDPVIVVSYLQGQCGAYALAFSFLFASSVRIWFCQFLQKIHLRTEGVARKHCVKYYIRNRLYVQAIENVPDV
jgi:hypothetical protein